MVLRARVTQVTAAGRSYRLGGRLLVLATGPTWTRLLPSERLQAVGRLAPAVGGDLTGAVLSARGPPVVVSGPSVIQRVAASLRSGLRRACETLPSRERGLLPGLVLGDTTRLDPALAEQFRATGLTHLVAVSGTNLAIVCAVVLLLVRRLRAGPRTAAALAALALVGFVVLARPSPSVLRAAVMGLLALMALALGRARAALPGLCAAVVLLLLVDPALARSAGFALSVLATGGLLLLAPPWRAALRRRLPPGLADALAIPAAAQIACAPVIAAISGQVGLVAVPANLLAMPAVAPATLLGVLAVLLSPVWPAAAGWVAHLAGLPTAWLVTVAEHGAHVPGATLPWPVGSIGGVLLGAVLAAVLLLCRVRPVRRGALCALCAAGVVGLPLRAAAPGWPPAGWVLVVCDVGQGDALVLNAGPHTAVVVDTGPDPGTVDQCLRRLDVRRIPLLVITHLHGDHVDGLPGVLHGRSIGTVEVGPLREPALTWRHVEQQLAVRSLPVVTAVAGEQRLVGGLRLSVLAPRVVFHGTRSDPNNNSVVLRVEVGGRTLLLSGEVEVEGQQALLASGADLRADVLKVAHHGSAYQEPKFLAAVRPRIAVVPVGADNPYGHPSEPVLARLRLLGADVLRTDRDGDCAVAIRGGRLFVAVTGGSSVHRGRPARRAAARAPPRGTMIDVTSQQFAPLRLVIGDEELLVARAVREVVAAARALDSGSEVHDVSAGEIVPGAVAELVSPSLFGGRRIVVVRNGQEAGKDLTATLLGHAADLADEVTLVVTHLGAARGKALSDGLVEAGAVVVSCAKLKRASERFAFVRDEVLAAGGSIDEAGIQALLDAVGNDLRELASACAQLVIDGGGAVDAEAVARYYRGQADVSGFTVADKVLVGDVAGALSALRWALSLGVDPVPIADALADGVRTVSRVASARGANSYSLAAALRMPPWKVERAQRLARGWSAESLGRAMRLTASLNADVKGNAGQPVYALERAVLAIANQRGIS